MESLQAELVMSILSRVPTLDLLKLSSVCRRWRNILNDPLFRRLHYSHFISKPNNENRLLLLKRSSWMYMVDLTDETMPHEVRFDLPDVPDFSSYQFIGSCNGLLCLGSTKTSSIFIMNPFTRQHMLFSMHWSFRRYFDLRSWGFGFDEIRKLYKVVVVAPNRSNRNFEVNVCDLGGGRSSNWRNIGETTLRIDMNNGTLLNGRLHWIIYWEDGLCGIISFDLAIEEFIPIPTPDYLPHEIYFELAVLGDHLCILYVETLETPNLQIWVMKEYGEKASWVKEINTRPLIPSSLISNFKDPRPKYLKGLGYVKDDKLVLWWDMRKLENNEEAILISSDSTYDEFKFLQLERPQYLNGLIIHTACLNWFQG